MKVELLIVSAFLLFNDAQSCIYVTNISRITANVHFLVEDYLLEWDFSFVKWDITIRTPDKVVMNTQLFSTPKTAYLKHLEEWTDYTVILKITKFYYVENVLYEVEAKRFESNFTTIPRMIRIDAVRHNEIFANLQVFDPQRFKARFEYGPIDTYHFTKFSQYDKLQGIGVISHKFPYLGLIRIRVIVKSKPECPIMEKYVSEPKIVYIF